MYRSDLDQPRASKRALVLLGAVSLAALAAPASAQLGPSSGGASASANSGLVGIALPVANVAALRALTSAISAELVILNGYYSASLTSPPDAGGGIFVYDSSDTTTADNGGTIVVDAASRRWKRQFSGPVDVKWFGAKGNGSNDDTTSIQGAINFCFGTALAPNSAVNNTLNYPLRFSHGNYKITSPLLLMSIQGGWIYGDGKFATIVTNTTANGCVFIGQGVNRSIIEQMELVSSGTGICLDLGAAPTYSSGVAYVPGNVVNAGTVAYTCIAGTTGNAPPNATYWSVLTTNFLNCQSVSVRNIETANGAYGITIGTAGNGTPTQGFQCSEIHLDDIHYNNHTVAGLFTDNANALNISVSGGIVQNCVTAGIWILNGNVASIIGVGFENQGNISGWDILISGGGENVIVEGCRSESNNFISAACGVTISECNQDNATPGIFANHANFRTFPAVCVIEGCTSNNGILTGPLSIFSCDNNTWGNTGWNTATGTSKPNIIHSSQNVSGAAGTQPSTYGGDGLTFAQLPTVVLPTAVTGSTAPITPQTLEGATLTIADSPTSTSGAAITTGGGSNRVRATYKWAGNFAISNLASSGITVTATIAPTSALSNGQSIAITGATQTAYNGTVTIAVTGSPPYTQFTYTFAGSGTSPATGTPVYSALGNWTVIV